MSRRALVRSVVLACIALVLVACGGRERDTAPSNETTTTTVDVDTTMGRVATTFTVPGADTSAPSALPVACEVLVASVLPAGSVDPSALVADDQPAGVPAPSNQCRFEGADPVALVLYHGRDPLETLAFARQVSPGGIDVTGIGQDAYYVDGVLFVDTGQRAFALTGGPTQDELVTLARHVIAQL